MTPITSSSPGITTPAAPPPGSGIITPTINWSPVLKVISTNFKESIVEFIVMDNILYMKGTMKAEGTLSKENKFQVCQLPVGPKSYGPAFEFISWGQEHRESNPVLIEIERQTPNNPFPFINLYSNTEIPNNSIFQFSTVDIPLI